jgi:hypothetical protein
MNHLDFIKELILAQINAQLQLFSATKSEMIEAKIELEKYILEVEKQISALEELKKKYEGGSPQAARILFYKIEGTNKEIIEMAIQKVTETKKFGFKAVDQFGNEATVEMAKWALSEPAKGSFAVSEDGKEAVFTPAGEVGDLEIQLAVDAKIGDGEMILNGVLPLTLIAGDAVAVEIKEVL